MNKMFSTKIIRVKFPDERGKYTGKAYNYFLYENLSLPNLSDRIQIKLIRDFGDSAPQRPNYDDKNAVVIGAFIVEADSIEEYADKILTYGDCSKTIYDYKVISSIVSDVVPQKENTLFIQTNNHEKIWYWQKLNNIVATAPYGTVRELIPLKKEETIFFEKKKERKSMKNIFGNIMKNVKFGQLNTDKVAYSMQGMAFKSSDGDYLVYKKDQPAVNVNEFVIEMPLFVMPVPLKDLQVGDIICKGEDFVLVDSVGESYITAINTDKSEIVTIVPQVNMFGFSFYSKVVAPTNLFGEVTQDNPFGNILPLMMMTDEDNDSSVFGMMMLMSQMNSGNAMNMDFSKIAPFFLLGNQNGKDDIFKMMALMSMMNNGTEKRE